MPLKLFFMALLYHITPDCSMVCIGALQVRRLVVAYGLLVQGLRHTRCGLEESSSAVRRVLRLYRYENRVAFVAFVCAI